MENCSKVAFMYNRIKAFVILEKHVISNSNHNLLFSNHSNFDFLSISKQIINKELHSLSDLCAGTDPCGRVRDCGGKKALADWGFKY